MKKSIFLILLILLFFSCSSIPTHEQQYSKINPNIFFTKFKAENFANLADIFTNTAKKTNGFKRQISALENPYIAVNTNFNTFIYGELFYFSNLNSAQSYILNTKLEVKKNQNKLFKDSNIIINEYGIGIDDDIVIIFSIQKANGVFIDDYVVGVWAERQ